MARVSSDQKKTQHPHRGCRDLVAIEGVSLLGDHNGIMDDDLLRELMDDEDFGGDPLTDSAP